MNDKELSTIPGFIRFRLTECCYALEYPDAPLRFYRELVNLGIVSCGKYSPRNDQFVKGFDSGFHFRSFVQACFLSLRYCKEHCR